MTHRFTHIVRLALVAALVAAAVTVAGCGDSAGDAAQVSDEVQVHVNGQAVRQSAVDTVRAEARFDGGSDDAQAALREAIDRELLRQEAERLGVAADEAEVDARAAALAEQAGGDEALATLLENADMTRQQLRASLEYGLVRAAVHDVRFSGVTAGDAQVRRFYERNRDEFFTGPEAVHLAAVLVRNEGIAANALKRVRQGHTFAEVSRQFSIDPELKAERGDMGWIDPASLPDELRKVVDGLGKGQVSEPVQAIGGWYVFKVKGRREAEVTPFDEVRDELAAELTRRKRSAALDKWLRKARDSAAISRP
jgi:parvulin-like peptidyl-prolyl isomerase